MCLKIFISQKKYTNSIYAICNYSCNIGKHRLKVRRVHYSEKILERKLLRFSLWFHRVCGSSYVALYFIESCVWDRNVFRREFLVLWRFHRAFYFHKSERLRFRKSSVSWPAVASEDSLLKSFCWFFTLLSSIL